MFSSTRIREVVGLFRLRSFDTSTAEGRSRERYRRVAITTIAGGASKAVGALTLLVTVPLTLSYLGAERYGLWMTIASVVTVLNFADFGIGNGLINAVSEANGKEDQDLARHYVSSAFFMLCGIAIFLSLVFAISYPHIPWQRLFNVHSGLAAVESGPAVAVFFVCFIVNIPLSIVSRIQVGYQQTFENTLWLAFGNILALCTVVLACKLKAGLPWLVLAMSGAPIIATILNGVVLLGRERPWLLPAWRFADKEAGRAIFRVGMMFLVLQIAVALSFSADNIIVAQTLGSSAVTQYAIPVKMFGALTVVFTSILAPLWPAYGEALARREFSWIRKTLKRSIAFGLAFAIPTNLFLLFFGRKIIHMWVGTKVSPSCSLLGGLAIWGILNAIGFPISMFLNGASVIRFQVVIASLMAIVNLGLSIILTMHFGVSGPVWGSIISYSGITLLSCAIYVPKLLNTWDKTNSTAPI
jgi:O-antigen/teichoic acid export membrane protein